MRIMRRTANRLPVGKLSKQALTSSVLPYLGSRRADVVLRPRYGEDAGAVKTRKGVVVIATDPITGSKNLIGWLSVHINANDVAVCGARPTWFAPCILLPKNSTAKDFRRIAGQIDRAAKKLGIAVVTGHSEIAPYIEAPLVVGSMAGQLVAQRIVTTSGARPGDWIVMTKWAGLEGSAILATDYASLLRKRGVSNKAITEARRYYNAISVVKEALSLAHAGAASSMHDPTEGGVLGGLYEMADASGCGFKVHSKRIPITKTTHEICRALKIDPLRLISSGVLLATIPRRNSKLLGKLKLTVIGKVVKRNEGMNIIENGKTTRIKEPVTDELWKIVS